MPGDWWHLCGEYDRIWNAVKLDGSIWVQRSQRVSAKWMPQSQYVQFEEAAERFSGWLRTQVMRCCPTSLMQSVRM